MNILYAEDDSSIAEIVIDLLLIEGHQVTHVLNGVLAYNLMQDKAQHFDLLITDHMMPDMKGSELVCKVINEGSQIPVLVVSASMHIRNEFDSINLKDEPVYFINKPFDIDTLTDKIKEIEYGI